MVGESGDSQVYLSNYPLAADSPARVEMVKSGCEEECKGNW